MQMRVNDKIVCYMSKYVKIKNTINIKRLSKYLILFIDIFTFQNFITTFIFFLKKNLNF